MNIHEQKRRSFLFTMGALGVTQMLSHSTIGGQDAVRQGYVLSATEGDISSIFVTMEISSSNSVRPRAQRPLLWAPSR
jgi:hypothetical protein